MANWPVVQLYEFDYFVHSNFLMHLVLLTGKGLLPDFLVYLIFLNVITLPPEKYLVYYLSGDLTILMISRAIQNQAKITSSLAHLHVSNFYFPNLLLYIDYYFDLTFSVLLIRLIINSLTLHYFYYRVLLLFQIPLTLLLKPIGDWIHQAPQFI